MKSMYQEQVKRRLESQPVEETACWQEIWKIKMHERLQLLLWKVFCDILPTKGKIAARIGQDEGEKNRCSL